MHDLLQNVSNTRMCIDLYILSYLSFQEMKENKDIKEYVQDNV